jgi:hypothetical protein
MQEAGTVAETPKVVVTVVEANALGVTRPSVRIPTTAGIANLIVLESFIFNTP